jgi:hypothetical protein
MGRPYKHVLNWCFECIHIWGLISTLVLPVPPLVKNSCVRPCMPTVTSREIPSIFLLVKVDISILIGMIPVALSQDLVNTILVAFNLNFKLCCQIMLWMYSHLGTYFNVCITPPPLVKNSCVRPCMPTVTSREIPSIFLLVKIDMSILIGMILVAFNINFKLCKCCHCMYVILLFL